MHRYPAPGMFPPRESLVSDDDTAGKVDDRLDVRLDQTMAHRDRELVGQ